jgi:phosphoglucosamine mutase
MKRLFGADGIRGIIDQYPFRSEDQVRLGRSLAKWWLSEFYRPIVLLGTDTRESNQRIKAALVDGLTRSGIEVWDAGILPTAAISFSVASNTNLAGGVMISASHNPIFENGIKVFDQRGMKISDENESDIEELFFSEKTDSPTQNRTASVRPDPNFIKQYMQALANEFEYIDWRRNKILVDCANGASYITAQSVLSKVCLHYALHNAVPDGTNINYSAGSEYVRRFPRKFANELQKSNADIGIAFDGDADRVVFVDRDGLFYDGDMLLASIALLLKDQKLLKNNKVVCTQMSNSCLAEHLKRFQIETDTVRNGDKYITDVLVADDLTLGGEEIGHLIIHTDPYHVTGDGLRTALWILGALSRDTQLTLHALMRGMRKWPQINVSVSLGKRMFSKSEVIPGLCERKERIQDEIKPSRFECRPASTEPVYRIMLEAKDTPLHILTQHAMGLARHVQRHFDRLDAPVEILDCVSGGMIDPNSVSCLPE